MSKILKSGVAKSLFLSTILLLCTLGLRAQGLTCRFDGDGLPQHPDTLRILGVGNSFTDDGMIYLPDLLQAANIGPVVLGRLYIPGCSLEQHCHFYTTNADKYIYYKSEGDGWQTINECTTLAQTLTDEQWDVVVLQQASHFAGIDTSYYPWLNKLIEIVRSHSPNQHLCFAWQMTWAYAADTSNTGFALYNNDQQQMYKAIVDVTQRVVAKSDIRILIPTGTTIQNLRTKKEVKSLRDMTRDGYHLDLGIGRYAAACTWFESLIAPVYGVTINNNNLRITKATTETTPVTDDNAHHCWRAVRKAMKSPFSTSK